jgi:hypothetical protein
VKYEKKAPKKIRKILQEIQPVRLLSIKGLLDFSLSFTINIEKKIGIKKLDPKVGACVVQARL